MKAFLKINRIDPASTLCLRHWCEIFKMYETFILCDLYDPQKDPAPSFLKSIIDEYQVTVINSDYSIGPTYCKCLKGAKHGMASANMTCFQHLDKSKAFWIIDADDTMFLTRNYDFIREKLLKNKGLLKLENFVIDRIAFQHSINNYPEMPHGIYVWHKGTLWNTPLKSDVIVL